MMATQLVREENDRELGWPDVARLPIRCRFISDELVDTRAVFAHRRIEGREWRCS